MEKVSKRTVLSKIDLAIFNVKGDRILCNFKDDVEGLVECNGKIKALEELKRQIEGMTTFG